MDLFEGENGPLESAIRQGKDLSRLRIYKKLDWFWFAFWAIITLATIFSGCDKKKNPPPPDNGGAKPPEMREMTPEELALITAHNDYRKSKGLQELSYRTTITAAAQGHVDWMAANNVMSHIGKDGSTLGTRLREAGYNYIYAGENIAAGYAGVGDVMAGWKNSNGHNNNILNPNYDHIGVAVAKSASGKKYWCVDFGRWPSGQVPVEARQQIKEQNLPGGIEK